jgi:hypothetical protein
MNGTRKTVKRKERNKNRKKLDEGEGDVLGQRHRKRDGTMKKTWEGKFRRRKGNKEKRPNQLRILNAFPAASLP